MLSQNTTDKLKIQKTQTDTIDYTYLLSFKGYHFVKVLESSSPMIHRCGKQLSFSIVRDSFLIKNYTFFNGTKIKNTDTIVDISWYIIKETCCLAWRCGHPDMLGKIRLNRNNNILVVEKTPCPNDKKATRLFFKVLKFSEFEIILEDIESKGWHRTYYFRKN